MKQRHIALLMVLLFSAVLYAGSGNPAYAAEKTDDLTLVIVHTNDFHGNLKPFTDKRMDPKEPVGGAAYVATIIKSIKKQYPGQVLLLDAGDSSQGTPISNMFKGRPVLEIMNYLGYDAWTFGNHEFDWQQDAMREMSLLARFPILVSNIVYEDNPQLRLLRLKPYIIKDVNGVKVGILGVITPTTPTITLPRNVKNIKFLDPVTTVRKYIPEMKREGANLIVVLSHCGFKEDMDMVEKVRGIDIVVGGHSHTALAEPKKVRDTILVQTGSYGRNVGRLVLKLDARTKKILSYTEKNELIPVKHENLQPDPEVAAIVAQYEEKIRPTMAKVIATASVDMVKAHGADFADMPIGNVIADSVRDETGSDVAFYNTGGVRGEIYKGDITMEKIYMVIPFENLVVAFDVPGSEIKKNLELAAGGNWSTAQVSGLTCDVDYTKNPGERISNIMINGKPLDEKKIYRVSTVDLLFFSGDGYDFSKGTNPTFYDNSREVFIKYLTKVKNVTHAQSERVRVVGVPRGK